MSFLYQDLKNKKLYPNLNVSGIYKITNKLNKKIYIGSSINIFKRWNQHLYKKRTLDITKKQYITRAIDKYGNENFIFEILAVCPIEYLVKLEQWFIDNLIPEYNIRKIADDNRGIKHTEEFRQKVKNSLLLRTKSFYENVSRKRMLKTLDRFCLNELDLGKLKGYYEQGISVKILSIYFKIPYNILRTHLTHKLLSYINPVYLDKSIFDIFIKIKYGVYNINTQEEFEFTDIKEILKLKNINYKEWRHSYKYIHKNLIYNNLYIMYIISDKQNKINYFLTGKMKLEIENNKLLGEIKRVKGIKKSSLFIYDLIDTNLNTTIFTGNKYEVADLVKVHPDSINTSYNKKALIHYKYKILKHE